MANIAFIGLGNMGGPMAKNLVARGHKLKVFDLVQENVQALVDAGAEPAESAGAAARDVDMVVTMLPAGKHVRAVYADAGGIMDNARPGTLFVDCSTIDVESARWVAAEAQKRGFAMVDAPVSGGVAAATAGTLTFMVGGSEEAFIRAQTALEAMGRAIIHAGDSGTGQAAKICNNMILGITMIATCEAFVLAEKLGLDHQKLFDIASKASGQSWSLTSYCPVPGPVPTSPANRDYKPGFAASMMLKDLRLAQDAARSAGAETPLGADAMKLYEKFESDGFGGMDFSGIINMLRSGIKD
jgi:3-hydroxyisobutyrate dehydrogenase